MQKESKSTEEVGKFLKIIKNLIQDGKNVTINLKPWKGKVNKTLAYMTETNISKKIILDALLELEIGDYCYTQKDLNDHFEGEFWFFTRDYCLVDKKESMYIKLKLLDKGHHKMLVMSFHPQQPSKRSQLLRPLRSK